MNLYNHWLLVIFSLCFYSKFLDTIETAEAVMTTPQFATFRRFVLTGSIAAVTATGAWYGAGLKMKQDIKQV